ncbi:hypothetical protein DFJ74DRAFT_675133 [Hyaloraphidium curvatum]|nr:hypothetical protein DFJ74DRAFT_675133 [Hyaloraphidium curvatum]
MSRRPRKRLETIDWGEKDFISYTQSENSCRRGFSSAPVDSDAIRRRIMDPETASQVRREFADFSAVKKLAEAGDVAAMVRAGDALYFGLGADKNRDEALMWWRRAAWTALDGPKERDPPDSLPNVARSLIANCGAEAMMTGDLGDLHIAECAANANQAVERGYVTPAAFQVANMIERKMEPRAVATFRREFRALFEAWDRRKAEVMAAQQGREARAKECENADCPVRSEKKSSMQRYSRCRAVMYCGAECQKADWRRHKRTCKPALPSEAASASEPRSGESKGEKGEKKKQFSVKIPEAGVELSTTTMSPEMLREIREEIARMR